jgi:hypothetical protein
MSHKLPHHIISGFYIGSFFLSFTLCSALNLLEEDWESGNTSQWNSWGSPSPILNSSANAFGSYSLDPNGDGSYHSGVVSKQMFSLSSDIRFTIDAYIESASAWSELEFGLVDTNVIPNSPNTSNYTMASVIIDADTQNTGYKLYANFSGEGASQTIIKNEIATSYFNDWHSFTFDFETDGSIAIAIDEQSIFSSGSGVFNYNSESDFAIMLAGRSYASSDNLYDNISLVQIPEFAHASFIVSSFAFIFLFFIRNKPSPSN